MKNPEKLDLCRKYFLGKLFVPPFQIICIISFIVFESSEATMYNVNIIIQASLYPSLKVSCKLITIKIRLINCDV